MTLRKFRRDRFEGRIDISLSIEHVRRDPHAIKPTFLRLLQNKVVFLLHQSAKRGAIYWFR